MIGCNRVPVWVNCLIMIMAAPAWRACTPSAIRCSNIKRRWSVSGRSGADLIRFEPEHRAVRLTTPILKASVPKTQGSIRAQRKAQWCPLVTLVWCWMAMVFRWQPSLSSNAVNRPRWRWCWWTARKKPIILWKPVIIMDAALPVQQYRLVNWARLPVPGGQSGRTRKRP